MYIAHQIMATPDRTPKERRLMAEIRHVGPVEWKGDLLVNRFDDGSSLMVVMDENLTPVEFLAVAPQEYEDARAHADACLNTCDGWDMEELSANIESNFPDLEPDVCDEIAEAALKKRRH